MLLVQNLMLDLLVNEEVVLNEDEIFTQVLGGKRSGQGWSQSPKVRGAKLKKKVLEGPKLEKIIKFGAKF
jgi:hypothetical protein